MASILRVLAWQVDNEYGCHDTTLSYSRAAALIRISAIGWRRNISRPPR